MHATLSFKLLARNGLIEIWVISQEIEIVYKKTKSARHIKTENALFNNVITVIEIGFLHYDNFLPLNKNSIQN